MLTSLPIRKMKIKTTMKFSLTVDRMLITKKTINCNKIWQGGYYGRTCTHHGLESKIIYLLWKLVWRFLKELNLDLPYDLAIPLLDINPKDSKLI